MTSKLPRLKTSKRLKVKWMNMSGIKPINCNVLVKPDAVDGMKGMLHLPDDVVERERHAQTRGTLVDRCEDAFQEMAEPPEAGTRVAFAKYGGASFKGDDGEEYRMLKDIDITGVAA